MSLLEATHLANWLEAKWYQIRFSFRTFRPTWGTHRQQIHQSIGFIDFRRGEFFSYMSQQLKLLAILKFTTVRRSYNTITIIFVKGNILKAIQWTFSLFVGTGLSKYSPWQETNKICNQPNNQFHFSFSIYKDQGNFDDNFEINFQGDFYCI